MGALFTCEGSASSLWQVEAGSIFVDGGDGSNKREPSDPPRTWRQPVVILLGFVVAVVVVIYTLYPTDELAENPPEASPVATTTTTKQAIGTTTITASTTTTIPLWRAIRDATAFKASDVWGFCVRASPVTHDFGGIIAYGGGRILDADEWIESLSQDDWLLKHDDLMEAFLQEVTEAGMALDSDHRTVLESVATYLQLADNALHDALQAIDDGEPDPSWAYHIARIESLCARAKEVLRTMQAMTAVYRP